MRAVLIVNPNATSTTPAGRDLLAHALESRVDLTVTHTDHRGHAIEIAEAANRDGVDVIIVHGGDGTVNEVVNGLLGAPGPGRPPADELPAVAVVPGGSANVFARALGISPDPIEATNQLIDLLGERRAGGAVAAHRPDGLRGALGGVHRRDGRRRRRGGRGGGPARQGPQGHRGPLHPHRGARDAGQRALGTPADRAPAGPRTGPRRALRLHLQRQPLDLRQHPPGLDQPATPPSRTAWASSR